MKAAHVIERARERYGMDITTEDVRAMEAQIVNGRSVRLEIKPNQHETHLVQVGDVVLRAVWRPSIGMIVTVQPRDARCTKSFKRRKGVWNSKGQFIGRGYKRWG